MGSHLKLIITLLLFTNSLPISLLIWIARKYPALAHSIQELNVKVLWISPVHSAATTEQIFKINKYFIHSAYQIWIGIDIDIND